MYIIAGLGNPTLQYEGTRHNVGFEVIDVLSERNNIPVKNFKSRALIGKGIIGGQKVMLVKPQTYMNLSGESIGELVHYFNVDEESELIVVFDDVSLEVGQLRIRKKGSAGGHNGVKSIISHLGDNKFLRIKVGVGEKPKDYDLADYVLGHFSREDQPKMKESFENAAKAVEMMISGDVDGAMNIYNTKPKKEKKAKKETKEVTKEVTKEEIKEETKEKISK